MSLEIKVGVQEAYDLIVPILEAKQSIYLTGAAGVGKSAIVRKIADDLFDGNMIDLRLSQMDQVESKGVPTVEDGRTVWAIPSFFPREGRGVFFIDELPCTTKSVLNAFLQLILDRRIGDRYKLPDGWVIIAAGNKAEHGAAVVELTAPMKNRLVHIAVEPRWKEVRDHFISIGVSQEIISCLDWRPNNLHVPPSDGQDAFPTPRTWEMLHKLLSAATKHHGRPLTDAEVMMYSYGTIGQGAGAEFMSFRDHFTKISPADIIEKGNMPKFDKYESSVMYAATGAVAEYFCNHINKHTDKHVENLATFCELLPAEFLVRMMANMNLGRNSKLRSLCIKSQPERFLKFSSVVRDLGA